MWKTSRHNNYARLTGRLRVVMALLIRMVAEAGFHFSEFIRFLGNRISAASGGEQVSTNTTIDRGPLTTARLGAQAILACLLRWPAGRDGRRSQVHYLWRY